MDDKPASAWFWYFIGIWVLIGVALIMLGTGTARAQQPPLCAPLSQLVPAWEKIHNERIVWEGVSPTPQGPIELVLFQSEEGTWSLFMVQGGIACLRAAGGDATPLDRGV